MIPGTKLSDQGMSSPLSYALVTPARNEEEHVERVIRSVVGQTHPPVKWVIVSDASTDETDSIVRRYVERHAWIELVRMPEQRERHFAAKVECFRAGQAQLKDIEFEVIGNLDADISFENDYFEFLMLKFAQNPELGVAGTPFKEGGSTYDYRFTSIEHVSGACQLFRRKCFEDIGGYTPIRGGGIDLVAVLTARMKGWQTKTFTERFCVHHRQMGTASLSVLRSRFHDGEKDYALGGHPVWEVFRTLYQTTNKPYAVGGMLLLIGFFSAWARQMPRPISDDLVHFRRREQMRRLRSWWRSRLPGSRRAATRR